MSTYPETAAAGRPRRRGRPARIDRDAIVDAALELGLDTFSMQAVADRLGVTSPALYSHVAGRDEVVALAWTRVADELTRVGDVATDWRGWLREFGAVARRTLAPSVSSLAAGLHHPEAGARIAVAEPGLRLLMAEGLSPSQAGSAVWLVYRTAITAGPAPAASFRGYLPATGELLAQPGDPRDLVAVRAAHGALVDGSQDTFAFDLQVVLDGIAAQIRTARRDARRGAPSPRQEP